MGILGFRLFTFNLVPEMFKVEIVRIMIFLGLVLFHVISWNDVIQNVPLVQGFGITYIPFVAALLSDDVFAPVFPLFIHKGNKDFAIWRRPICGFNSGHKFAFRIEVGAALVTIPAFLAGSLAAECGIRISGVSVNEIIVIIILFALGTTSQINIGCDVGGISNTLLRNRDAQAFGFIP